MAEDLLLTGATLLHLDPPKVERGDVRVRGGRIVEVAEGLPAAEGERQVDLEGKWLMPGLVCAHHHLYSALACGMPFVEEPPADFADMLAKVWWRLDRALDEDSVRASGLAGGLAALRAGTTTIVDHHASPSFIEGSLEVLDEALDEVGQRRILCYEVSDRGGLPRAQAGIDAHRSLLAKGPSAERAMLVGVHASFTVCDDTLERCAALAREHGVGLHMHVAEAADDERTTGEPLLSRFGRLSALLPGSLFAHGVHLSRDELWRVEEAGVFVTHQARSNMNNGVGYAPLTYFGDNSLLGTDGIDGDMLAELKTAYFRAQDAGVDMPPDRMLGFLTRSARYASERLGVKLGRIEEGFEADLVVLDPSVGPPLSTASLAATLIFRLSSAQVRSVLIGGRFRLLDREPTGVDEGRLTQGVEHAATALWERMKGLAP